MAITEDASQPAAVHATGTSGTTAAFSPPSGSLLVVLLAVDGPSTGATTATVSDSGSHAWSLLKRQNTTSNPQLGGSCEIWVCYLASAPGSITITGDWSANGAAAGDIVPRVLNGAASTQNGATGGAGGNSIAPTCALTPTVVGSHVYGAALDYTTNASLTANAQTTSIDQFNDATNGDTWAGFKGAADTTTLSSTTFGYTNAAASYNIAAAEILPALDGGTWPSAIAPGRTSPGGQWAPFPFPSDPGSQSIALSDSGTADDSSIVITIDSGPAPPQPVGPGRLSPSGTWSTFPGSLDLVSTADTGSGADSSIAVAATVPVTDSGSADDSSVTVTVTVPIDDSGTADDASIVVTATVPVADSGTGTDSVTVSGNDPGPAAPQPTGPGRAAPGSAWQPFPFVLDPGSAAIPVGDSGTGADTVTVTATIPATDTGTGSDAAAVAAAAAVGDTATASEALSVLVTAAVADAGAALEALGITVAAPIADTGSAADAASVSVITPVADSGAASDAPDLTVALSVTDSGTGVDAVTVAGPAGPPVRGVASVASQTVGVDLASRSEVRLR